MPTPVPAPRAWVLRNVADVRARIAAAAGRAGRDPAAVRLVAVTKSVPAGAVEETVRDLAAAGVTDVAENRPVSLAERRGLLAAELSGLRWHLVGHWQRNKVRKTLPAVDFLHSLDSLELMRALAQEQVRAGRESRLSVLLQVNVSGEQTKGGFSPDELEAALVGLRSAPSLQACGLMTMAPYGMAPEPLRSVFGRLRELRDWARGAGYLEKSELSMGMSEDFETAVEEGSTMVRIGRRLFAPPPEPADVVRKNWAPDSGVPPVA